MDPREQTQEYSGSMNSTVIEGTVAPPAPAPTNAISGTNGAVATTTQKNYATRMAILSAVDLRIEELTIPEWDNVTVRVRGLMGYERDQFEQSMLDQRGKRTKMNIINARAKLCQMCLIDENNEKLFSEEDITHLGMKSASALDKIYDLASRLSGISDEDMNELTGNLKNDPNDGSSSS